MRPSTAKSSTPQRAMLPTCLMDYSTTRPIFRSRSTTLTRLASPTMSSHSIIFSDFASLHVSVISRINGHNSIEKPGIYPTLEPLIGARLDTKLIFQHWEDLLRLAASIKQGTVTASNHPSQARRLPTSKPTRDCAARAGKVGTNDLHARFFARH